MGKCFRASLLIALGLLATQSALAALSPQEMSQSLKTSFETNLNSASYVDWETSGKTPEDVFSQLAEKSADPISFCQVLNKLSIDEITFFEDAIREHKALTEPCQQKLIKQVENYWALERSKLYSMVEQNTKALHGSSSQRSGGVLFRTLKVKRNTSVGPYYVSGDVQPGEVVLTFDDGPHPSYTGPILNALAASGAQGIFFPIGKNAQRYPSLIRQITSDGNRLGSHSHDHANLSTAGFNSAVANMKRGHQAVFEANGGWIDPFFRFPYGAMTKNLKGYVKNAGIANFFWHIDSHDWNKRKTPNARALVQNIMRDLNRKGRGIILMHDVQRVTREALPALLKELYYAGYTPVIFVPQNSNALYSQGLLQ